MAKKKTVTNDPVADWITLFFKMLFLCARNAFYGAKRLRDIRILSAFCLLAVGALVLCTRQSDFVVLLLSRFQTMPQAIAWMLSVLFILCPFFFLALLGAMQMGGTKDFATIFEEIDFIGKDKRYPVLVGTQRDGHKQIFFFHSQIPLETWKRNEDQLETSFDCSIRSIEQGKNKQTVRMVTVSSDFQIPELIHWNDDQISPKDGIVVVGESDLEQIYFDLNSTPHVLAAGETGSGKSVLMRCMLWQMISKGCMVYMIDFKGGVEFGLDYEQYGEVVSDRERALVVLQELVQENELRMELFRKNRVKNLPQYNKQCNGNLCRIALFVDELAEMLDKAGASKVERELMEQLTGALSTIARLGRAQGINLFLGVQRPDANVMTGQIKNNVSVRLCGYFADRHASEIVLGNAAATELPKDKKGRFLYKTGGKSVEFQSYYFDDEKHLKQVETPVGNTLRGLSQKIEKIQKSSKVLEEKTQESQSERQIPKGLNFGFSEDDFEELEDEQLC